MNNPTAKTIDVNRALWFGIAISFGMVRLIWLSGELWLEPPAFAERQPTPDYIEATLCT